MSYCRWSTPNCDLYCYESVGGFYSTNVASYRERAWKDFYHWLTDRRIEYAPGKSFRVPRWGYLFWVPHWISHAKIGLPEDGEAFADRTLIEFRDRVKWLAGLGYRVPDYLLPEIEKEITP
jgi:hypothetical protein